MLEFSSTTVGFRGREESGTFGFGRRDEFFILEIREELDLLKVCDDEENEGVGRECDDAVSIAGRVVETSLRCPEFDKDGQRSNERMKVAVGIE